MQYKSKTDLTKNALADSLRKAIMVKPINKITVNEIVKDAGFNRQTFYYHFDDIFHLLSWMLDKEIISEIIYNDKSSTWQEAGTYLLEYLRDNQDLSLCLLNAKGSPILQKFFYDNARSIVKIFLEPYTKTKGVPEEQIAALSHYYSLSLSALLEDWITGGMKREPKDAISILDMIISGTTPTALERFSKSTVFNK